MLAEANSPYCDNHTCLQKLPNVLLGKKNHFWVRVIHAAAAAAAKSLLSCLTLCDPIDGSPPGFPAPGILQARILEWVTISFSNLWKWKVKVKSLSHVRLLATPWTPAHQAPLSMGFSRQEYWSVLPWPSPESDSYERPNVYIHCRTLFSFSLKGNSQWVIPSFSQ